MKKVLSATKGPGPKRSRRKATSKPLSAKEKQRLAESNERFKKLMEGTEFNPKAQKRKALKGLQLEAQRKAKKAKRGVDKKKQAAVKKKIIENKKRIRKPPISPPKEKSIDDLFIKDPMFLKKLAGQLGITVSELKKRRAKAKKDKTVRRQYGGLIKLGKKVVSPKPKPRTRKRKKPVQNIFSDTTGAGRGKFEKGGLPKRKGEAEGARLDPGSSDYKGGVGARTARDVGTKGEKVTIGGLTINNFVRDQASKGARARGKAKAKLAKLAREGKTLKIRNQAKAAYNKMEAQDIKAQKKQGKNISRGLAKRKTEEKKDLLRQIATGQKRKSSSKKQSGRINPKTGEIIGTPTKKQEKAASRNIAARKRNENDKLLRRKQMGGKVVKKNMGGNLKSVNTKKNPGLAKLPTPVRNKMGFAKGGGKVQYKMGGGKIKGYKKGGPTNPISTKGSYGGKKKVAKADWMQGLSPAQIQEILGGPTKDASGVIRHSKKKTKKKKKVVKAMGGRKVLYRSIGGTVIDGNDILKMIYD